MRFLIQSIRRKVMYLAFIILSIIFSSSNLNAASRDFYAIKVYHLKDQSQVERVEKYLKDAYLPAVHRAGIKKVGVLKPIEANENDLAIYVWIPLKSLDQLSALNETVNKDPQHQAAGAEYIESAFDNPPYSRIETIMLKAFEEMPQYRIPKHQTTASERVYELRSYEGPTEKMFRRKMEMFNAGGEIKLFEKLDFNAVFYAEVISGSTMPNLMYMTTFASMKAHDEHWATFRAHPEWKSLSEMEKYQHTVSRSVKYLLHPTNYSDL